MNPNTMSIYEIYNKINEVLPLNQSLEWDNTGILVNSGFDSKNILLTIDITEKVIEECKIKNIGNIIAYHPILFTGLKKINKNDIVYKLIKNNINVFSPHTSWDATMNEHIYKFFNNDKFNNNFGLNYMSIKDIIKNLKRICNLSHIRVAMYTCDVPKYMVVGVGSAFKYHTFFDSVIITGEMSHHCLLHSLQNRNTVILLEHSNSERIVLPYIKTILQKILPEYKIFISDADSDPINFY